MGSSLIAPPAKINQTLPKVFSACGKKWYEHRFFQLFKQTGPSWCACVVSLCRRLHAHAVSSVQGRMVLAVWRLVEPRVYGRPLVWLTIFTPSGRFGDNQYMLVIISNWEMQRIVGDLILNIALLYRF